MHSTTRTQFYPIKLLGAIQQPTDYEESKIGLLNAIIRYKTPFQNTHGEPLTISLALGEDVSTNTIFGLPTMDALELVWDITSNTAMSKSLGVNFPIERRGSKRGLPDGITFDSNNFNRTFEATTDTSHKEANTETSTNGNHTLHIQVDDEFSGQTLISSKLREPE